jgi:hypothetical protein
MADGQYGGNGSVHWFVTPDRQNAILLKGSGPKGRRSHLGVDYAGESSTLGEDFLIRIKLPDGAARLAFLDRVAAAVAAAKQDPSVERVEVTLPIDKGPDKTPHTQIQICWGTDPSWYDGLDELHAAEVGS